MIFNLNKYKKWLLKQEKELNIFIDKHEFIHQYQKYDGLDSKLLWEDGLIVLIEWCD